MIRRFFDSPEKSAVSIRILSMAASVALSLFMPEVQAVQDNELKEATNKFIGYVTGNMVPITTIVGAAIGLWRTYHTSAPAPLVVCTGAGAGGGLLLDYIQATHPCLI